MQVLIDSSTFSNNTGATGGAIEVTSQQQHNPDVRLKLHVSQALETYPESLHGTLDLGHASEALLQPLHLCQA